MLKKIVLAFVCGLGVAQAQVVTIDTTATGNKSRFTIGGYIDAYWGFDFNKPETGDRPYFVSMARHNEMNINLAYLDLSYSSSRVRARFMPGFGTYMNSNYANEPGTLKYLVEANVGVLLFKEKKIWLDAGVLSSPFSPESAISKDQFVYTRSLASENVPYYLSGVKVTLPLSRKLNAYFFLLNGWQQIQDVNSAKAIATQIEFRPTENLLLNWNTYFGNEQSAARPEYHMRYFSDFYFIYKGGKWDAKGCLYSGIQKIDGQDNAPWWQINLIGRYHFNKSLSVSGRVEYFNDKNEVLNVPITSMPGFTIASSSLGLDYRITDNVMFRAEWRTFLSESDVYLRNNREVNNSNLLISNLTFWF